MSKQGRSKKDTIQRIESERDQLWGRMLEALSEIHGLSIGGPDALEAELSELVDSLEELDVENVGGISAHSGLRKLWAQYHELGEQLLDIQDTGMTLENYDPNPDPSLTKEKVIAEAEKILADWEQFIEDAEDAGFSREELDEMLQSVRNKMIN